MIHPKCLLLFCLSSPSPLQSGGRRSNFSSAARRQQQQQQQQQNSANSMMQPQHGRHAQQDSLSSHCVSPMSQGGQGAGVSGQPVPDPHQVGIREQMPGWTREKRWCRDLVFPPQGHPRSVSSQTSQQNMRSSSSNKHVSSSSATPSSSYSLLQPLVPEVKEMSSGYTRLSANSMVGERSTTHPPSALLASCLLPVWLLTRGERG